MRLFRLCCRVRSHFSFCVPSFFFSSAHLTPRVSQHHARRGRTPHVGDGPPDAMGGSIPNQAGGSSRRAGRRRAGGDGRGDSSTTTTTTSALCSRGRGRGGGLGLLRAVVVFGAVACCRGEDLRAPDRVHSRRRQRRSDAPATAVCGNNLSVVGRISSTRMTHFLLMLNIIVIALDVFQSTAYSFDTEC